MKTNKQTKRQASSLLKREEDPFTHLVIVTCLGSCEAPGVLQNSDLKRSNGPTHYRIHKSGYPSAFPKLEC